MTPCLVIFTYKGLNRIFADGGSQAWVLNRPRAKRCEYAVLCRNARHKDSPRGDPHGAGFLVGRISDVIPAPGHKNRSLVLFDAIAMIDMPDLWKGRSPVQYKTLEDLGIDPAKLDWRQMPERAKAEEAAPSGAKNGADHAAVIGEAKQMVAASFGIPPEAVEITIHM